MHLLVGVHPVRYMTARIFMHPRIVNSPVANGAFAAHLIEKGFDMKSGWRAVFRNKYFELCRVISETVTGAEYETAEGVRFSKGVIDPQPPVTPRAA